MTVEIVLMVKRYRKRQGFLRRATLISLSLKKYIFQIVIYRIAFKLYFNNLLLQNARI